MDSMSVSVTVSEFHDRRHRPHIVKPVSTIRPSHPRVPLRGRVRGRIVRSPHATLPRTLPRTPPRTLSRLSHLWRTLAHLLFLLCLISPFQARAADVETETRRFLTEAFTSSPTPQTFWLVPEHKPQIRAILGHDYPAARLRYWQSDRRTAWVLEEIGKELPITVGVIVDNGRIERMRVLAYRESRGWEVQSSEFLRQFAGSTLKGAQLDRPIDGISGATLSVRALTNLARLSLWLHAQALQKAASP